MGMPLYLYDFLQLIKHVYYIAIRKEVFCLLPVGNIRLHFFQLFYYPFISYNKDTAEDTPQSQVV